jgi:hypothetical protein
VWQQSCDALSTVISNLQSQARGAHPSRCATLLKLYPEVAPLYRAAIQQHRKLRSRPGRLERLSRIALAHRGGPTQRRKLNENPGYSHILPSSRLPSPTESA